MVDVTKDRFETIDGELFKHLANLLAWKQTVPPAGAAFVNFEQLDDHVFKVIPPLEEDDDVYLTIVAVTLEVFEDNQVIVVDVFRDNGATSDSEQWQDQWSHAYNVVLTSL